LVIFLLNSTKLFHISKISYAHQEGIFTGVVIPGLDYNLSNC